MALILINFDFPEKFVQELKQKYPDCRFVVCKEDAQSRQYLATADVLVTFFGCTREIVEAAPALEWIQAISAGVDFMPLDLIFEKDIILTNGRGIHKIHMAEYAIAAMINLARGFHQMFRNQVNRWWDRSVPQFEIYGKTVGIVGLGAIGGAIAEKAALFGMRVIGSKRRPEPMPNVAKVYGAQEIARVFEQSDYVINLLPYTEDTEQLIDKALFDRMKRDACFINIGRGRTVNEPDLIEALQKGTIRAMASDVFYEEPLPEESPLWDLENVILTPHICGVSPQYMKRAMEIIDHNLNVYLSGQGEMINRVDPSKKY